VKRRSVVSRHVAGVSKGGKALWDMYEGVVCIILIYIGEESASLAVESGVDC